MKNGMYLALASVVALAVASNAQAASVFGNISTAQLIGSLAAGQAYTVSGSGVIGLCGSCNNGGPLNFNPDGTVANTPAPQYSAFSSGPQDHDPSQSPGSSSYYGPYGPGVYLGALYGSFTATPTSASDLFLIGYGTTISAGAARTLYGVINDSDYGDNPATAFTATLNRAATGDVPEPASWAMMLAGFGAIGMTARRRQKASVTFG